MSGTLPPPSPGKPSVGTTLFGGAEAAAIAAPAVAQATAAPAQSQSVISSPFDASTSVTGAFDSSNSSNSSSKAAPATVDTSGGTVFIPTGSNGFRGTAIGTGKYLSNGTQIGAAVGGPSGIGATNLVPSTTGNNTAGATVPIDYFTPSAPVPPPLPAPKGTTELLGGTQTASTLSQANAFYANEALKGNVVPLNLMAPLTEDQVNQLTKLYDQNHSQSTAATVTLPGIGDEKISNGKFTTTGTNALTFAKGGTYYTAVIGADDTVNVYSQGASESGVPLTGKGYQSTNPSQQPQVTKDQVLQTAYIFYKGASNPQQIPGSNIKLSSSVNNPVSEDYFLSNSKIITNSDGTFDVILTNPNGTTQTILKDQPKELNPYSQSVTDVNVELPGFSPTSQSASGTTSVSLQGAIPTVTKPTAVASESGVPLTGEGYQSTNPALALPLGWSVTDTGDLKVYGGEPTLAQSEQYASAFSTYVQALPLDNQAVQSYSSVQKPAPNWYQQLVESGNPTAGAEIANVAASTGIVPKTYVQQPLPQGKGVSFSTATSPQSIAKIVQAVGQKQTLNPYNQVISDIPSEYLNLLNTAQNAVNPVINAGAKTGYELVTNPVGTLSDIPSEYLNLLNTAQNAVAAPLSSYSSSTNPVINAGANIGQGLLSIPLGVASLPETGYELVTNPVGTLQSIAQQYASNPGYAVGQLIGGKLATDVVTPETTSIETIPEDTRVALAAEGITTPDAIYEARLSNPELFESAKSSGSELPLGPVIRTTETPISERVSAALKAAKLTTPEQIEEAKLGNENLFPKVQSLSLKIGANNEIPLVSRVIDQNGTNVQLGIPEFEDPETVRVPLSRAGENNANLVTSATARLIYQKALSQIYGAANISDLYDDFLSQIKKSKLGIKLPELEKIKLPGLNQLQNMSLRDTLIDYATLPIPRTFEVWAALKQEGINTAAAIMEYALSNLDDFYFPSKSNLEVFGTASVQQILANKFRAPGDVDVTFEFGDPYLKEALAEELANNLNKAYPKEGARFRVSSSNPSVVEDTFHIKDGQESKVLDSHIQGEEGSAPSKPLGFSPDTPIKILDSQGLPIYDLATLRNTILGKGNSALTIREAIIRNSVPINTARGLLNILQEQGKLNPPEEGTLPLDVARAAGKVLTDNKGYVGGGGGLAIRFGKNARGINDIDGYVPNTGTSLERIADTEAQVFKNYYKTIGKNSEDIVVKSTGLKGDLEGTQYQIVDKTTGQKFGDVTSFKANTNGIAPPTEIINGIRVDASSEALRARNNVLENSYKHPIGKAVNAIRDINLLTKNTPVSIPIDIAALDVNKVNALLRANGDEAALIASKILEDAKLHNTAVPSLGSVSDVEKVQLAKKGTTISAQDVRTTDTKSDLSDMIAIMQRVYEKNNDALQLHYLESEANRAINLGLTTRAQIAKSLKEVDSGELKVKLPVTQKSTQETEGIAPVIPQTIRITNSLPKTTLGASEPTYLSPQSVYSIDRSPSLAVKQLDTSPSFNIETSPSISLPTSIQNSISPSVNLSPSSSLSNPESPSINISPSPSPTVSVSTSPYPSVSQYPSPSPYPSPYPSISLYPSLSPSPSISPSPSPSPSPPTKKKPVVLPIESDKRPFRESFPYQRTVFSADTQYTPSIAAELYPSLQEGGITDTSSPILGIAVRNPLSEAELSRPRIVKKPTYIENEAFA